MKFDIWRHRWFDVIDFLFLLRINPGVRIVCPDGLYTCSMQKHKFSNHYKCEMNTGHPVAHWLLFDCAGLWSVGIFRPWNRRKLYLAFSRPADALIFQMQSDA